MFLVFHTNASKFSREWRLHFTDKYMKNKILICGFLCKSTILKFDRLPLLAGRYVLQVAGCRLQVEKWTFKSE